MLVVDAGVLGMKPSGMNQSFCRTALTPPTPLPTCKNCSVLCHFYSKVEKTA